MAHLVIKRGPRVGEEVPLNREVIGLGRAAENAIVLDERDVSRYHAQIREEKGRFVLCDLHSTNGTFVNGKRLSGDTPHYLRHGDEIQVASGTLMIFVDTNVTQAVPVTPLGREAKEGDIVIDRATMEVRVEGQKVEPPLAPLEYRLLLLLYENRGRVVNDEEILARVWAWEGKEEYDGRDRSLVYALVHRLRQRLEPDPTNPRYVLTRPGYGYLLPE